MNDTITKQIGPYLITGTKPNPVAEVQIMRDGTTYTVLFFAPEEVRALIGLLTDLLEADAPLTQWTRQQETAIIGDVGWRRGQLQTSRGSWP